METVPQSNNTDMPNFVKSETGYLIATANLYRNLI